MNNLDLSIRIDIVKGGFVVEYPAEIPGGGFCFQREVFVSPRKMHQKLKEIIDAVSTTPDDSNKSE